MTKKTRKISITDVYNFIESKLCLTKKNTNTNKFQNSRIIVLSLHYIKLLYGIRELKHISKLIILSYVYIVSQILFIADNDLLTNIVTKIFIPKDKSILKIVLSSEIC